RVTPAHTPSTTQDTRRRSQEDGRPGRPCGGHQGAPLTAIVQTVFSSGTTGDPVVFALTGADLDLWREGIATGFFPAGIRSHDVVAHLVGLPGVAGGLPYADGFRRIGATLAWIGGGPPPARARAAPRTHHTRW